ncbi:MAG: sensor histidine kinase [Myxococcaceae bacterium]|nr:sensor histidine kinase [Myxococcaceae bacterium]
MTRPLAPWQRWSVPAIYALAACGWIFLTDELVERFAPGLAQQQSLQTAKGLFFVGSTAVLLIILLRREQAARDRLERVLGEIVTLLEFIRRAETLAQAWPAPSTFGQRLCDLLCEHPDIHSAWLRVRSVDGSLRLAAISGTSHDTAESVYAAMRASPVHGPRLSGAFGRGEYVVTRAPELPPGSDGVAEMCGQPVGSPMSGVLLVRARRPGFFQAAWGPGLRHFGAMVATLLEQRRTRGQLDLFLDEVPVGVFVVDSDNRLQLVNRFARAVPGAPPDLVGQRLSSLLAADQHTEVVGALDRVRATRLPVELRSRIGLAVVDLQLVPLLDSVGLVESVVVFSRDVTEALRQEDELRALTRRSMTLREDEQARLSRDLHDDLGQRLTALKLQLRAVEHRVSNWSDAPGQLVDEVVEASALADETLVEVQRISQALRPASLEALGLAAALDDEVQTFERRTGLSCTRDIGDPGPLAPDVAAAVFRIGQEALTNVARHAQAKHVRVRLARQEAAVVLEVEDDGIGLAAATPGRARLGLRGMLERAAGVGGALTVLTPEHHRGTRVILTLPQARP